jgi:hypothetical protein
MLRGTSQKKKQTARQGSVFNWTLCIRETQPFVWGSKRTLEKFKPWMYCKMKWKQLNSLVKHYRIYECPNAGHAATITAKVIAQYSMQQNVVRVSTRGRSGRIWGRDKAYTRVCKERYQVQHAIFVHGLGQLINPKAYEHGFLPPHGQWLDLLLQYWIDCRSVNVKFHLNTVSSFG